MKLKVYIANKLPSSVFYCGISQLNETNFQKNYGSPKHIIKFNEKILIIKTKIHKRLNNSYLIDIDVIHIAIELIDQSENGLERLEKMIKWYKKPIKNDLNNYEKSNYLNKEEGNRPKRVYKLIKRFFWWKSKSYNLFSLFEFTRKFKNEAINHKMVGRYIVAEDLAPILELKIRKCYGKNNVISYALDNLASKGFQKPYLRWRAEYGNEKIEWITKNYIIKGKISYIKGYNNLRIELVINQFSTIK